ncbi:MAG: class I SAM-dependent methyltransferase [Phycisphaerales bacterium]|nr:MAG: class I SAM-dependent methyltransferase [Phycisphaerales bacterium]
MAKRRCPVWLGYLLNCPLRKFGQNPKKMLGPYLAEGMKVLDVGCAMGFFSLPLARMVGPTGKVICVDVQEKMIRSLEKRARRAGLAGRIETRLCGDNSLGLGDLGERIDFVLAAAVVHEIPDTASFFSQMWDVMKPAARLLLSEPKGHVSGEDFERTVSVAKQKGFVVIDGSVNLRNRVVVLAKKNDS